MMASSRRKLPIKPNEPFFIFDTHGEWHATLLNNCLWNARGEYIGFVRGTDFAVYTAYGEWIGNLTADGRVVRKRANNRQPILKIRKLCPRKPQNLPPRAPLPPLTGDLGYQFIDVLEWDPEVFDNVPDLKDDLT